MQIVYTKDKKIFNDLMANGAVKTGEYRDTDGSFVYVVDISRVTPEHCNNEFIFGLQSVERPVMTF